MKPTVLVTGGSGFIGAWVVAELLRRKCRVIVYDLADGGAKWRHLTEGSSRKNSPKKPSRIEAPKHRVPPLPSLSPAPSGGEGGRRPGEEVVFVRGDILDAKALKQLFAEYPIRHVIHLVGLLTPACQENPQRGCEINVLGTTQIFELIRECKSQIQGVAYASSIAVYGAETDDPNVPESVSDEGSSILEPLTFYGAFKRANELIARQYWQHFGIPSVGLRPPLVYGWGRETGLTA